MLFKGIFVTYCNGGKSVISLLKRGYDLSTLRARQVEVDDFHTFDYVLAMDRDNHERMTKLAPKELHLKIQLFLDYAPEAHTQEVPDPYYGGERGFEEVLDLVEAASQGLLSHIRQQHL